MKPNDSEPGSEMSSDYDVIIVGARVAGSVLAALLGQRGHRVLLLDKARFPKTQIKDWRLDEYREVSLAGHCRKVCVP